jgi:hypothetical protein
MANPTGRGGFKISKSGNPDGRPRRGPETSPSLYHCERKRWPSKETNSNATDK